MPKVTYQYYFTKARVNGIQINIVCIIHFILFSYYIVLKTWRVFFPFCRPESLFIIMYLERDVGDFLGIDEY
jgi:hypothetical protein